MDLAEFREYCLNKPGATEDTPFGDDVLVFRVGGKIFSLTSLERFPVTVNIPIWRWNSGTDTIKSGRVIT
jgi:predicted DNA-binding protein (MmcQ/YjbR family)